MNCDLCMRAYVIERIQLARHEDMPGIIPLGENYQDWFTAFPQQQPSRFIVQKRLILIISVVARINNE